ncbi:DUF1513 domain-containing protein [Pusillimonas sp. SM2304]|uniref:DUF1513 domain-containing protein n=1 Tax=Pusillimonas sp. SM2304 TaxID=3073241 RepID=UPI002874C878|nr:DUF1513 domain-containing protein [Pusillimonas sp. SM2304]MDS1140883.1 DUF1513 domain-containing protein [Pusillimonas sp. SM2304]
MEIDRRRFLALLAASGAGALATGLAWARSAADGAAPLPGIGAARYLAARQHAGRFEAALLDGQGRDQQVLPLPGRGHSFAIDAARGRAVAFGRQPGFFAVAFDVAGEQALQSLDVAPGRHFFGHGVYSPDGQLMLATENDYEAGRGVLGIYDASPRGAYRRVGEFSTYGVGPHEVVLMPDGGTVCVANGGILTHPDYGKLQLNADTMQPSLAYIDIASGDLLEQVYLDKALSRLSIRHMVVDGTGAVWFGCQHTGPAHEQPALVGRHRRGAAPDLFTGASDVLRSMRNYVGSLAVSHDGLTVATSSPVGGLVAYWDAQSGRCLGSTPVFDGCGVAPAPAGGFLVSSGEGVLTYSMAGREQAQQIARTDGLAWDNHLRRF